MRSPKAFLAFLAFLALPARAAVQSSQFGIRGLGYPNVPYSARARAMAGSSGLFDTESALNPASMAYLTEMTASFSILGDRRNVQVPGDEGDVRSMRFPMFSIVGPLRRQPLAFGVSVSTYLAKDFSAVFRDTLDIRGVPTETVDTLSSSGGVNDLRFAGVWRVSPRFAIGGGIHAYTGVQRMNRSRNFQDSGYVAITQSAEVSAAGVGFDIGVVKRLSTRLTVAGVLRTDGHLTVRRDSFAATEYPVDLPVSLAAGAQWRPAPRLMLTGQGRWLGWGSADADLRANGGPGARDSWEVGMGGEWIRHPLRPAHLPLRFGLRRTTLPFPATSDGDPAETAATLGTGFSFRDGMGTIDGSLERVWRSEGSGLSEHAWLFTPTASLRPNRRSR